MPRGRKQRGPQDGPALAYWASSTPEKKSKIFVTISWHFAL